MAFFHRQHLRCKDTDDVALACDERTTMGVHPYLEERGVVFMTKKRGEDGEDGEDGSWQEIVGW